MQFSLPTSDGEVFWWHQNTADLCQYIHDSSDIAPKFAPPHNLVRDSCVQYDYGCDISTLHLIVSAAKSYCGLCCAVLSFSRGLPTPS